MTLRTVRPGRLRGISLLALFVVAAGFVLGACGGVIGSTVGLESDYQNAGYSSVKVGYPDTDQGLSISVHAPSGTAAGAGPAQTEQVARVVWANFPYSFTTLFVTVHDPDAQAAYSYARLRALFGPRRISASESLAQGFEAAVIWIIGVLVVAAGLVVALVLTLRRRSRRRRLTLIRPPGVPTPEEWKRHHSVTAGRGGPAGGSGWAAHRPHPRPPGPAATDRPTAGPGPAVEGPGPVAGGSRSGRVAQEAWGGSRGTPPPASAWQPVDRSGTPTPSGCVAEDDRPAPWGPVAAEGLRGSPPPTSEWDDPPGRVG